MIRSFLLLLSVAIALPVEAVSEDFLQRHGEALEPVFTHLNSDHAEVGPIRRSWENGERMKAATALISYFESKDFPLEVLQPIAFHTDLMVRMEDALADRFLILDGWETVPRLDSGGLDWRYRGERNDKEWAWMLNRQGFFADLAEAYRRSGDDRFRNYLNDAWQDWILNNPYPDRLTFSEPWRALEVARRILHVWVHLFYSEEDLLDAETQLLILSSVLHHGDALREHASFWGGNHLISEKLALLTLAFAWPEFEDSSDWGTYAIDRVSRQLMKQTYPDGSYKELSNHYQRVVLVNAQYFIRIMAQMDPEYRELPVIQRIEAMWDFFARVTQPDGSGPVNNASDRENNAVFIREVHAFYDRPDWLFIGTNGREGTVPEGSASRLFPWAGQAILRNGWDDEADWVYFDAGPYGTAHQHIDRLHVSASLKGRPTLVDNGRYTYVPGPWRDYFKGPESHNVLFLDGQAARQGPRSVKNPMPVIMEDRADMAMVAASSTFQPGGALGFLGIGKHVPWTRAVLLDKRGFLLVVDHIVTFADHELEARWHFHPRFGKDQAEASIHLLSGPRKPIQLNTLKGSGPPDVAGYYSPDYNTKEPAPELRFSGRIDQPTTLLWVLQDHSMPALKAELLSKPGAPVLDVRIKTGSESIAHLRMRLYPEPELLEYKALGP